MNHVYAAGRETGLGIVWMLLGWKLEWGQVGLASLRMGVSYIPTLRSHHGNVNDGYGGGKLAVDLFYLDPPCSSQGQLKDSRILVDIYLFTFCAVSVMWYCDGGITCCCSSSQGDTGRQPR